MVAPRVVLHVGAFGRRPLGSEEVDGLRPLELGLNPTLELTVEAASVSLLERLVHDDDSTLLLAYCRLNRDDVVARLDRLRDQMALPLRTEPLAAEVLAQTLDAARARGAAGARREYRLIPRRCREAIRAVVDECLGFVPASRLEQDHDALAASLADHVDLPDELFAIASRDFEPATARVVAAQTLLQFSRHDRAHLLRAIASVGEAEAVEMSAPVVQLLSREAALDRFRVEISRAAAWMKACTARTQLVAGRSRA
jgi:hypothetical protein